MHAISHDTLFPLLQTLSPSFFLQDTSTVARALLNCVLFTLAEDGTVIGGRIVETESYTQNDEASHSYNGQTQRCRAMFMEGGTAYVYIIYGMYYCCNVVTGKSGRGNAVLLRSLEPYWGLDVMVKHRSLRSRKRLQNTTSCPKKKSIKHTKTTLCRGPGCLSMALGISTSQYNETRFISNKSTKRGSVHLMRLPSFMHVSLQDIVTTTRIGITKSVQACERKSRFYINHNSCVSYPLKRKD